jgi:hypothetical protein
MDWEYIMLSICPHYLCSLPYCPKVFVSIRFSKNEVVMLSSYTFLDGWLDDELNAFEFLKQITRIAGLVRYLAVDFNPRR